MPTSRIQIKTLVEVCIQDSQSNKVACTHHIDFSPQFLESLLVKGFCEYIGELILGGKRLVTCFGHRAQYESNRWMGPDPLESTWNFLFRKCLFALFGIRMKNSRPFQIQDFWKFDPKLFSLMAPLPPLPPS